MNPKNDKHALIGLGIAVGFSIVSVIAMALMGAGFWSIFGLSPMLVFAEYLGRSRNGI